MGRRDFLAHAGGLAAMGLGMSALAAGRGGKQTGPGAALSSEMALPRWCGFNLLEKFSHTPDEWIPLAPEWGHHNEPFREEDFAWIAAWGFNYARLPMSYLCWSEPQDPRRFLSQPLQEIDQAVAWGQKYQVHVCLNFHRAPGYCINPNSGEPLKLWTDAAYQELFLHHWRTFAERYRGISSLDLSFNLVNEPRGEEGLRPAYLQLVRRAVEAIHTIDPGRLVVADGWKGGNEPLPELLDLPLVHSTHQYKPGALTHYKASWSSANPDKAPSWPTTVNPKDVWNKERLQKAFAPWRKIQDGGGQVHIGEWGCYKYTAHAHALAWMRDCLEIFRQNHWGWALWCFRGSFGILDSGREDVVYEDFCGHQLDRQMLTLLQGNVAP
jgi:endoglucanase